AGGRVLRAVSFAAGDAQPRSLQDGFRRGLVHLRIALPAAGTFLLPPHRLGDVRSCPQAASCAGAVFSRDRCKRAGGLTEEVEICEDSAREGRFVDGAEMRRRLSKLKK